MTAFDSNTLAALGKSGLIQRHFVFITGKDSEGDAETWGFWNGVGAVSVSVVAAIDGQTGSRTYVGGGSLLAVPPMPFTLGLEARSISLRLSQVHAGVLDMIRGNDIRHGLVEVHRGYFDTGTGQIVSTPFPSFFGKVNRIRENVPAAGSDGAFEISIASTTRDLTLVNTLKTSDESQRLRSDDRFRRYAGAGSSEVFWGEAKS